MAEKNILLVEDDRLSSDLYKSQLEKKGYKVLQALDPEEALELLKTQTVDLIILDLIMPMYSGMDVLKKIKENIKQENTPIIILTNIKDEKIIKGAKDLGAKDYLIKSAINPDQIPDEIKKYL